MTHNVKESRIKALLKKTDNEEVLFHHRFATSTIDIRNACHPFSTKDNFDYQYVGVHNGVVRNSWQLRTEHEKLGIKYVSIQENNSFNDSEALIYDLARYFEGQVDDLTAYGSIAFIVVKRDKEGNPLQLFFGHNAGSSTLKMKKTANSLTVSSEGEGDHVPINMLHIYDYETNEIRTRDMYIPSSGYSTGGSAWNHAQQHTQLKHIRTNTTTYPNNRDTTPHKSIDYENDRFSIPRDEEQDVKDLKREMDSEFTMRDGDKQQVGRAIFEAHHYNAMLAAVTATIEIQECDAWMSTIDRWATSSKEDNDEESYEALVGYWMDLGSYKEMMTELADEYEKFAKGNGNNYIWLSRAKREETGSQPLGFHGSTKRVSNNHVTNHTDPKLLPSSVLANNNKEL